ncbi:hypothetical protein SEVIR_9G370100v4 [Setaria viridis]|uniref:Dof zinc finger protein n=1 Tax=Setaria viridis TaxID=4556 RepID=A0A4U6T1U0_SETVI|nr:dof zinc finger protein DOF3.6-like [Setaria viridis]TKV95537.1 hypothetical protein SEVIR_9G370100v2 [Setaria viridis]
MMHDMMRRKQTTKEDQTFSTMPYHGRIPTHGGGGTGSGSKEAHRYTQHQLPRLPGAPMAPHLSDTPAEASASADDGSAGGSCWVKPGCMMELARLAKIPQPASGLMCPRCRSTETKFCYYNNYSLSQPRHFCKTCRRYWTHGGALRDLPFSNSVRRRRRNKPSNNKQTSSKVACCGAFSGSTGMSPSSSPSSGATIFSGRVATAATAILKPLEQLLIGGAEHHRAGASRLWFPGHSSQDPVPLGYRHQLGNSRGAATTIRLEHQRYLPQRQPFSLLGYKNGGTAPATSAIFPFSEGAGGAEAASFAGQMHAAISRVRGSAAVTTTELASEMMAGNPTIPSTEMGTLASSPGEFLVGVQGDHDLFHFLGSGSWACGYGSTAGNNGSGGGSSCTAAPGSAWPDPSGFTSSSSGRSTIL